jgi:hypothetical protein
MANSYTVLESAARTATPTTTTRKNYGGKGLVVIMDVTAVTATPALTLKVEGYDPVSGKYWTILQSAAYATTGTRVHTVYPGATVATNLAVSDVLPRSYRVSVTHGDADSATYSVSAQELS